MPPEAPPPPGLLCNMVFTDGHFHVMRLPVSIKTFSTHVVVKKCHVVSEPGLFTHEKIRRRYLAEGHGGVERRGWEIGGREEVGVTWREGLDDGRKKRLG